ncbi:MAG: ChaN family lipoprotein [Chloracidobacterium sp.]|nr:ChaN family lipoprotein [Chloracidobacterium sp.]
MKSFVLFLAIMLVSLNTIGQIPYSEEQFAAFSAKGDPARLDDIVKAAADLDVVFLGELHDDAVGHAIQAEAFRRIVERYAGERTVILSLEMFERDVQTVLDEYLASLISEQHFLLSSRPWGNYKTDYRPLVELAKEKKLAVVAANAPRRYVNMVSRGGRSALDKLSKPAKRWLAPLPYNEASPAYSKKFKALMGPSAEAQMGLDNILSSQSLWDATMAYWIANALRKNKDALVVHLNGGFHTESRLGTVEHLFKYKKNARAAVVTMRYETAFRTFDPAKHTGIGDFVILTDAAQPRSKR